jgi:hypothetical protein
VKPKKSLSLPVLMALLALCGAVAVIAGVELLFGLAPALIVGGVGAIAVGLLVDV